MTVSEQAARNDVTGVADAIAAGAPLDQWDPLTGLAPLHAAALRNALPTLEALLAAGVRRDAPAWDGRTAMHLAASPEIARALVRGLRPERVQQIVNARDAEQRTPLHLVALAGAGGRNGGWVKDQRDALLALGADPSLQDRDGLTPAALGRALGNWEMACVEAVAPGRTQGQGMGQER